MFALSEIWLLSTGFFVSLLGSILIVLSKRWHGSLTFDTFTGPQKFHDKPTPRIGGLTLFVAFWMVVMATSQPTQSLLIVIGISGSLAFLAGLMEDLTKRAPVVLRLLATIISGLLFCVMTGYSVTQTEVYLVDDLIEQHFVSLVFTALAISGLTNAINVIDGFNGLAAGAVIIMASAFGVVAYMVDDYELVLLAAIIVAVLLGFLLVNFPRGYIFLGDGGAYFAGFLLASLAIMLPVRNSEISEWVSIMILAYPVLEFLYSIIRRIVRKGRRPTKPDKLHLHSLVYRSYARKIAKSLKNEKLANAITSVLLWGGSQRTVLKQDSPQAFHTPGNHAIVRKSCCSSFQKSWLLSTEFFCLLARHPILIECSASAGMEDSGDIRYLHGTPGSYHDLSADMERIGGLTLFGINISGPNQNDDKTIPTNTKPR